MTKKLIIGNWKMYKDPVAAKRYMAELKKLIETNKEKIKKTIKYGLAVPSLDIAEVKNARIRNFVIAAQNMFFENEGAYTGEISPEMIKSVGANAVLIGHSERRVLFCETDKSINKKVLAALEHELLPIICVGETLDEFEQRLTQKVIKKQLDAALETLTPEQIEKVVIAYEPVWAIGTGKTASPIQAEAVCKFIRTLTSKKTIIQYGGSVKPENIEEFLNQPNIDGALVGGASLDPKNFIRLLTLNS